MSTERFERDNCLHCSLDCGRIAELSVHDVCPEFDSGDELRSVSTIVADPPWLERGGGRIQRGAGRHYSLMGADASVLVMQEWMKSYEIAENAHMYLWVTNNHLEDGLQVMKDLGFRYITNICWVKPSFGLGYYFRGQHELCLFGVRGRGSQVKTDDNGVSSIVKALKRKHSQKPDEFYDLVERRSVGGYLYMFSRSERDGWYMEGDEVGVL
jgi:N6-adenosine-specific RNA methylase IME4